MKELNEKNELSSSLEDNNKKAMDLECQFGTPAEPIISPTRKYLQSHR
jgi:hypothetical protein